MPYALTEILLPPELAAVAQQEGGGCTEPSRCSSPPKMLVLSLTPIGTRGNLRAESFSVQQQWEKNKFTAQES